MDYKKAKKGEDLIVILLARGVSQRKAAKAAGIHEATLCEYLKDSSFKQRVSEMRNKFMDATVGQLIAMSGKALKTLDALINSDDDKVRLGAIRAWKEFTCDFGTQVDLAKRIQDVMENQSQ